MSSISRGDNPPKKLVRVALWREIEERSRQHAAFKRGPHLVISGRYGGDIGVLLAMGVHPRNIYAVDTDHHATAAAKHKFPEVNFATCSFWDAIEYFELKNVHAAHIDLFSPLRKELIQKIKDVYNRVEFLGYTYLCGRDKDEVANGISAMREVLELDAAGSRQAYLTTFHGFNVRASWDYLSSSASHIGKPMATLLLQRRGKKNLRVTSTRVTADWGDVRKAALRDKQDADLLYNVRPTTMAAWKAHETRGTYRRGKWVTYRE